jgi:hypothetical protein
MISYKVDKRQVEAMGDEFNCRGEKEIKVLSEGILPVFKVGPFVSFAFLAREIM